MKTSRLTTAIPPFLIYLIALGCQPVTQRVSVPSHGQGGSVTVRKLPPKPVVERPLPPAVVQEQERKQTRLDQLEARVKELEAENAELRKPATRPAP